MKLRKVYAIYEGVAQWVDKTYDVAFYVEDNEIYAMKNSPKRGHSARNGNSPSPYTKYEKKPFGYTGESRLANGDLRVKANDSLKNKYS